MMEYEIRHISLARYSKLLLGLYTKGVSRKCPLQSLSCHLILSCHIQYRVTSFILSLLCRCRHPHHFTLPVLTSFADEPLYISNFSIKYARNIFMEKVSLWRIWCFESSSIISFSIFMWLRKAKKAFFVPENGRIFLAVFSTNASIFSTARHTAVVVVDGF